MSKEQEPADNAAIAAERERYDDLQRSVMDLSHPNCKVLLNERNEAREQLATERQQRDALEIAYTKADKECEQLREQLATAVEALKQAKAILNRHGYFPPSIDAALAKIEEGKSC